jgi:RNA polymerase sigma factor (sigma-70 family)
MADRLPPVIARLLQAANAVARERAWQAFLADYSKLILHVCRSYGGGYDAVMDRYTFVVEQLRRDDGRRFRAFDAEGRGKFTTWLTVVLRRLCLDAQRKRYGRRQTEGADAEGRQRVRRDVVELVASLDTAQIADPAELPDGLAAASELTDALQRALAAFSAEDRLILQFRFEQELSVPEIGRVTGAESPFHVYRRLNRLLALLRAELARAGISEMV